MVVWNSQDIICAVIGGSLIAAATSLNLYMYGRITGISGVFNSIVKADFKGGFIWKYCFLLGLLTFPNIFGLIYEKQIDIGGTTLIMFD